MLQQLLFLVLEFAVRIWERGRKEERMKERKKNRARANKSVSQTN